MQKFIISTLSVLILVAGCTATDGRKEVSVYGEIVKYNSSGEVTAIYINELLLVPFPKNLRTMSTYWPIAKFPVDSDGRFSGSIFVCGPINVSLPGYMSEDYETDVDEIVIKIDFEEDAQNFDEKNVKSEIAASIDEEKYQEFLKVSSRYNSPMDIPCNPDFE